jgi:hypothetical protein
LAPRRATALYDGYVASAADPKSLGRHTVAVEKSDTIEMIGNWAVVVAPPGGTHANAGHCSGSDNESGSYGGRPGQHDGWI